MVKGRVEPEASSTTAYSLVVWEKGQIDTRQLGSAMPKNGLGEPRTMQPAGRWRHDHLTYASEALHFRQDSDWESHPAEHQGPALRLAEQPAASLAQAAEVVLELVRSV